MDRFARNFIVMSMVYLVLASILGVMMLIRPEYRAAYGFAHSHLMLLGWVSMMIYGVGYHILPRFAGRLLRHRGLAEAQFWASNAGLVGMVVFDLLLTKEPGVPAYTRLLGLFGALEALSIFIFFYNITASLLARQPEG